MNLSASSDGNRCLISPTQLNDINNLLDIELSMLPETSKEEKHFTLSNKDHSKEKKIQHKKTLSNITPKSTKKEFNFIKRKMTSLEHKLNNINTGETQNSSEFTISRATSFDKFGKENSKITLVSIAITIKNRTVVWSLALR